MYGLEKKGALILRGKSRAGRRRVDMYVCMYGVLGLLCSFIIPAFFGGVQWFFRDDDE